jgi:hypothetical protein
MPRWVILEPLARNVEPLAESIAATIHRLGGDQDMPQVITWVDFSSCQVRSISKRMCYKHRLPWSDLDEAETKSLQDLVMLELAINLHKKTEELPAADRFKAQHWEVRMLLRAGYIQALARENLPAETNEFDSFRRLFAICRRSLQDLELDQVRRLAGGIQRLKGFILAESPVIVGVLEGLITEDLSRDVRPHWVLVEHASVMTEADLIRVLGNYVQTTRIVLFDNPARRMVQHTPSTGAFGTYKISNSPIDLPSSLYHGDCPLSPGTGLSILDRRIPGTGAAIFRASVTLHEHPVGGQRASSLPQYRSIRARMKLRVLSDETSD